MIYFKAKLPIGVENIRHHLENVDDVPLHVPLFTDVSINNEADISIQIVPVWHQNCFVKTYHSTKFDCSELPFVNSAGSCPSLNSTILQISSALNCIDSILIFMPGCWDRIEQGIIQVYHDKFNNNKSRKLMRNIEICLVYYCICHFIIITTIIISGIFNAPFPLNYSQILIHSLYEIPLLTISHAFNRCDQWTFTAVPKKKNNSNPDFKYIFIVVFIVVIIPTSLILIIGVNQFTYYIYCTQQQNIKCNYFFYSNWMFKIFTLFLSSVRISLQETKFTNIFYLFYNIIIIVVWIMALIGIFEVLKIKFVKRYRLQIKRERLKFETKLGLNSPL
ncbi:hypothetical protein MXB_3391 [Myxobolus squamalis]|nr:hypothetical protein MXB_3391 [Myxobolus squamalis]